MPDANTLPENSLCQRAVSYLIVVVIICINRFVIRLDDKKKGPFSLQLARRVPEGCQENEGPPHSGWAKDPSHSSGLVF